MNNYFSGTFWAIHRIHLKTKQMKNFTISAAFILMSFTTLAQNICPGSFRRNNGNGTCSALGELRLYFPSNVPANYPLIDSVFIEGVKYNVQFSAPDGSHLGGNNGYLSYCVGSGNMPPTNVWTIFFHANGGGSYTCTVPSISAGPLAVKYYSFDASVVNKAVTCTWITEEEINNNYFELERSFDGIHYSTAAIIFAAENSSAAQQTYQYKDNAAALNNHYIVYYRIKQVDKDGTATYSKIVTVKMKADIASSLQASPNPFTENVTVKIVSAESGLSITKILNANGQTVATANSNVIKGTNNLSVANLQSLSKGIYVVQVSVNGVIKGNQKLIKN
jgi:hypothetical protein